MSGSATYGGSSITTLIYNIMHKRVCERASDRMRTLCPYIILHIISLYIIICDRRSLDRYVSLTIYICVCVCVCVCVVSSKHRCVIYSILLKKLAY